MRKFERRFCVTWVTSLPVRLLVRGKFRFKVDNFRDNFLTTLMLPIKNDMAQFESQFDLIYVASDAVLNADFLTSDLMQLYSGDLNTDLV